MSRFREVIFRLIGDDDGYYIDPANPGNERRWGLSKRDYPTIDMRMLERDQALDLYERDVWGKLWGDQLPKGLDWCVLSATMDYGPDNTIRWLQRSVDLADDGVVSRRLIKAVGERTLAAVLLPFIRRLLEFETRQWDFQAQSSVMFQRFNRMTKYLAEDLL